MPVLRQSPVVHRGARWRIGRHVQHTYQHPYQPKVAQLLTCLDQVAHDPAQIGLVFLDEMGFWRWAEAGQDWMAAPPATRITCAGTNRQWRIIGTLNAFSGQVDYLDNYIVGRRMMAQMYKKLDQK